MVAAGDHVRRRRRAGHRRRRSCSWSSLVPDLRAIASAVQDGLEEVRHEIAVVGAPDQLSALVDRSRQLDAGDARAGLAALAGAIGNVGTVLVLGTFLTFFLLADGDRGWAWFMGRSGRGRPRPSRTSATPRPGPGRAGTSGARRCSRPSTGWSRSSCSACSASRSREPSARSRSWPGSCPISAPSWAAPSSRLAALALGGPVAAVAVIVALCRSTGSSPLACSSRRP